jgi:hypothetical protein
MLPLNMCTSPEKSSKSSPAMVLGHRYTRKDSSTVAKQAEVGTLEGNVFYPERDFPP